MFGEWTWLCRDGGDCNFFLFSFYRWFSFSRWGGAFAGVDPETGVVEFQGRLIKLGLSWDSGCGRILLLENHESISKASGRRYKHHMEGNAGDLGLRELLLISKSALSKDLCSDGALQVAWDFNSCSVTSDINVRKSQCRLHGLVRLSLFFPWVRPSRWRHPDYQMHHAVSNQFDSLWTCKCLDEGFVIVNFIS